MLENNNIPANIVLNSGGGPSYLGNQVIVQFRPDLVNSSFANNTETQFAYISDVVPDSIRELLYTKLNYDYEEYGDVILYKVYKWITYSDSLSITRLGDTIVMPKLWSTFIMTLPTNINPIVAVDSLNTLVVTNPYHLPGIIKYAELNGFVSSMDVPDDSYFGSQISLIANSTYPNASIYCDEAWNLQNDESAIKVGIVEGDAVDYTHEDFGDGTFNGSVIKGERDETTNSTNSSITTFGAHATACAGIIGALRNNGKGIAGIAGGDIAGSKTGVALYSLSASSSTQSTATNATVASDIASAISFGAANTTGGNGYGLDIESYSYGSTTYYTTIQNAVQSAYNNGCVFVTSRGNFYTNADGTPNTALNNNDGVAYIDEPVYPACNNNDYVINVGASGDDGLHKVGGPSNNGDDTYESMYGGGVDLIAPGALDIVVSTTSDGQQFGSTPFSDTKYTYFSGTSSAAPHVAGVAALIMAHHNVNNGYPNNLDNTDVRHMLKLAATPITGGTNLVGNGRVNATNAMEYIDYPIYGNWVQHSGSYSETQTVTYQNISLPSGYESLSAGIYYATITEVSRTYNLTAAFGCTDPVIADNWLRHPNLGSDAAALDHAYNMPGSCNFTLSQSGGNITVNISTYCWILQNDIEQLEFETPPPSDIKTDFSLLLHNPAISGVKNISPAEADFSIYPNPSNDITYLNFTTKEESNVKIELINLSGTVIRTVNEPNQDAGSHLIYFDVADLAEGIYLVNFKNEETTFTKKLVVTH